MSLSLYYPQPGLPLPSQPFVAYGYAEANGVLTEAGIYSQGTWPGYPLFAGHILDSSRYWMAEFSEVPLGGGPYELILIFHYENNPYADIHIYQLQFTAPPVTVANTIAVHPVGGTAQMRTPIPNKNCVSFGTVPTGTALLDVAQLDQNLGPVFPDLAVIRGERWVVRWKNLAQGDASITVQGKNTQAANIQYLTVVASVAPGPYMTLPPQKMQS